MEGRLHTHPGQFTGLEVLLLDEQLTLINAPAMPPTHTPHHSQELTYSPLTVEVPLTFILSEGKLTGGSGAPGRIAPRCCSLGLKMSHSPDL